MPRPDIRVSHDVDAVRKTVPIRLKQTAMGTVITVRGTGARRANAANLARFTLGRQDWWRIDEVLQLEREFEVDATFNLFRDRAADHLGVG